MSRAFIVGDIVRRRAVSMGGAIKGREYVISSVIEGGMIRLVGDDRAYEAYKFTLVGGEPRWSDVRPGDTVEFEVQDEVVTTKVKGTDTRPVVLGWYCRDIDNIWDLRSVKKKNPPIPNMIGARILFREEHWLLLYPSMVYKFNAADDNTAIWVRAGSGPFQWLGRKDIDAETFEVLFDGEYRK